MKELIQTDDSEDFDYMREINEKEKQKKFKRNNEKSKNILDLLHPA